MAIFCAECFLFVIDYAKEPWFTQSDENGCSLFPIESEFHVTTSLFGKIPEPLAEGYEEMRRTPITHPMMIPEKTAKLGYPIPIIKKASKCKEPEEPAEKLDRLTAYLPEIIKEEVSK